MKKKLTFFLILFSHVTFSQVPLYDLKKHIVLIAFNLMFFVLSAQAPIEQGLVAYYPFSGNANDASGNGNDGTVSGATLTIDRFGNPNSAYSFNGSDNYISIPVDINYNTLPQLTMVCWAKPAIIPVDPRKAIISHDDGGYDREMCIDERSGTTGYSAFKGNGVFGSFPATVGQWDMITVAYDQTTNIVKLYKDTTSMTGTTSFGSGLNYTWIGGSPNFSRYFDGVIDEVRLYDRILTDDEIMMLFEGLYASFTASNDTICEGNTVSFTDQSYGNVISWEWTFEGGTPGTSTAQNPSVTYNTIGTYNVQLIVSDGTLSDTLLEEDFTNVSAIPAQPNTPTGDDEICGGSTTDYTTSAVAGADNYFWVVDPSDAGIITGTGTIGSFTAVTDWTGAYTVKVRAENECGDGSYSPSLAATLYHNPITYFITGGGGYCIGDPGRELILDGSETDIDYELYLDDVTTGIIMAGTGDSLNFGFHTDPGLYTVSGYTDHCTQEMYGQAYVFLQLVPGEPEIPVGPESVCNNMVSTYTSTGSLNSETYTWTLTPPEAATLIPNILEVDVDWTEGYSGTAHLSIYGSNACGDGTPSPELEITVNESPAPEISGDSIVCEDDIAEYTCQDNPGNTYTWEVNGGTITAGAGTHQITVQWGSYGTGYVMVTEDNGNCSTTTEQYEIIVDECTAIRENDLHNINIYPNPVKNVLNIDFSSIQEIKNGTINLINIHGNVIKSVKINNGLRNIRINTSGYAPGLYYVKIVEYDRVIAARKVVIER